MPTRKQLTRLYELYTAFPSISTDSRNVRPNSIFFALRGASFDGNRFAADALRKGAAAAVVDDPEAIPAESPGEEPSAERYILVDDALLTLQELAAMHRGRLAIPLLAITGTNGKTTTKELTAAVLSEKYAVHATEGNLNNHIGVPLTILSMTSETGFGIVEMGASEVGEIAALCRIAQPDYGIITNIGKAHLEGFGGGEGVKKAKGELYDWLAANGGRAFVRREDQTLVSMASQRQKLDVTWYDSSAADEYQSRLAGSYNRFNIAAAAAIGLYFGVEEDAVRKSIRSYTPSAHRSQIISTPHNTVIADCYNANPSSMQAALEWFGNIAPDELDPSADGKVAVLGDMLELGAWSAREHRSILERALKLDLRKLVLIGSEFQRAATEIEDRLGSASTTVATFPDTDSYISSLRRCPPASRKIVLVKGSRGIALERLLKYL